MIAIFPEIVAHAESKDIESLSVLVRKYFAGEGVHAPVLDVLHLVQTAGLRVVATAEGDPSIIAKDEAGAFEVLIVLPNMAEAFVQRFVLAHLLGHYFFHMQSDIARGEWTGTGFTEPMCPAIRFESKKRQTGLTAQQERAEKLADDFASALLLPRAMLQRAAAKIKDQDRLAMFFGVSRGCLDRRLEQIEGASTVIKASEVGEDVVAFGGAERQPVTPRSVAAGSYNKAAGRRVTTPPTPAAPKATSQEAENSADASMNGLERLRQIAKRIDKSVD